MPINGPWWGCLQPVSEHQVMRNAQIKRFPDGSAEITVFDRNIIRAPGFEAVGGPRGPEAAPEGTDAGEEPAEAKSRRAAANMERSQRRARRAVSDLANATDFEWFVTLTVSPDKLDRYSPEAIFPHLHDWLDNNVRRHGLAYVLVPEYHQDGAIHFHALFNDVLEAVDSGTISRPGGGKPRRPRSAAQRRLWLAEGGHVVYNLPGWGWGFTTAIRLYGDRRAAVGYVCKYISKSQVKIGGRWYYSGGKLQRPAVDVTWLDFGRASDFGKVFDVDDLGCHGVRFVLKEGEQVEQTLEGLRRTAADVRGNW